MIKLIKLFVFLTCIVIAPNTLQAQDFVYYDTVSELNRIDPLQNPRINNGSDIIGSNIQDRQNKVIGAVQDVILSKEGAIEMVRMNFEPIHLSQGVYLNYKTSKMTSYSDGYGLSFPQERLEEIYPQLLASIETASGSMNNEIFSISALKGSIIRDEKGTRLGEVIDVLFNKEKSEASSYLVEIKRRGLKGHKIAIPYKSVEIIPTSNTHPDMVMSMDHAKAIVDYVDEL